MKDGLPQRSIGVGNLPKSAWGLVLYSPQAKNRFYIFKSFFKKQTNSTKEKYTKEIVCGLQSLKYLLSSPF